jgi:hypothetical protein
MTALAQSPAVMGLYITDAKSRPIVAVDAVRREGIAEQPHADGPEPTEGFSPLGE